MDIDDLIAKLQEAKQRTTHGGGTKVEIKVGNEKFSIDYVEIESGCGCGCSQVGSVTIEAS